MHDPRLAALFLVAIFSACSKSAPEQRPRDADTIQLVSTLVSPIDVALAWKNSGPAPAGYAVEWTNDLKEGYVVLQYLPPQRTSYKHQHLMERSFNYYRVLPIHGPASNTIEIALPKGLSDAAYAAEFGQPRDVSWASPKVIPDGNRIPRKPIRAAADAAAAPGDLKAVMMKPAVSDFKLTWVDNASDEEGYLLEMKPNGAADYDVVAVLDPDINSIGFALEPPVRRALFRVRAFYRGKESNLEFRIAGSSSKATH